jgi:hypothetical protein
MRSHRALLLFVFIASISPASLACSFGAGYTVAQPPNWQYRREGGKEPLPPSITILTLKRGFDDGNAGSCSDAGVLELEIRGFDSKEVWGLRFELVSGAFPDFVIPIEYVLPICEDERRIFRFAWLDLPRGQTHASLVDARIAVRQISYDGLESEPAYVNVAHPGGGA